MATAPTPTAAAATIHHGDCLSFLPQYAGTVALLFADPPYNIGYHYDEYDDRKSESDYTKWTEDWIALSAEALTPTGSAFFMIGDEYAAQTRMAIGKAGLHLRNWIIWSYSFGQATRAKFGRGHVHVFYCTRDAREFTFNDAALRVPSLRGLVYNDARTNPVGRLPDDVWDCYPRLAGTFKGRQGWHGCQLPEELLDRIVTGCSEPGELVVDPFAGSGTTLVSALRYGRQAVGMESSSDYVKQARKRLKLLSDHPFADVAELMEAMEHRSADALPSPGVVRELLRFYRESGYPIDGFRRRRFAREHFTAVFNRRLNALLEAEPGVTWSQIEQILDAAKPLGMLAVIHPKDVDGELEAI